MPSNVTRLEIWFPFVRARASSFLKFKIMNRYKVKMRMFFSIYWSLTAKTLVFVSVQE